MPEPTPRNQPWSVFPSPEILDDMIVEVVDSQTPEGTYVPLPVGTPHPNQSLYPDHILVKELASAFNTVTRYWSTVYSLQDLYNYELSYSGEANAQPIYVRRYLVRRDQYSLLLKGSNMTGVWLISVTDGGSGYEPSVPPTVTISGGGGSGATAQALVDQEGVVKWVRILTEGLGYDSTPTVAIAAPSAGVTATAIATVQVSVTNSIASVTVTAPGSYASVPKITFTGDSGDGNATAVAQLNGTDLRAIVLTNAGRDFLVAPTVHISDSGGGTATAVLEELSMTLVAEQVQQLPQDDPRFSEFFVVTRVYETTPGPVLRDVIFDWKLRTNVFVQKRVVLSRTVPGNQLAAPTAVAGTRTEYQSTPNSNRSIQIVSSIGAEAPSSYIFFGLVNYRWPDVLDPTPAITIAFVANNQTPSLTVASDLGIRFHITEGYAGPCKAKITRHFTLNPTEAFFDALPTPTAFAAQAVTVDTAFTYGSPTQTIANARSFGIPQTIHQAMTFGVVPSLPLEGSLSLPSIPATVPPTTPTGYICIDINPTLDERFGVWVYDVVEVKHP